MKRQQSAIFFIKNISCFAKTNIRTTSNPYLTNIWRTSSSGHEYTSHKNARSPYFGLGTGIGLAIGISLNYGIHNFFVGDSKKHFITAFQTVVSHLRFSVIEAATRVVDSGDPEQSSPRYRFNFLADVAEKIAPSVVYIEISTRHPVTNRYIPISNGSGFIIKSDGLILTNAHVVANKSNVVVKLLDGREFKGVVEDQDSETDLATVRINANNLPVLQLGQSSKLRSGEFVIAMGNPLTLSHSITAGIISSANRPSKDLGLHQKTDYIQTDAAINVGNSGGPLVNLDGEAIGINTMKVTEGISFAIPSDRATAFLKRTETHRNKGWRLFGDKSAKENTKQKYLGITMLTLTPNLIQELQQRNPEFPLVQHGVLVWRVMFGSPAYEGGIRPEDIIISINDIKVQSASDIYKMLTTDNKLAIQIMRGKITFVATIKPQEPVVT